MPNFYEERTTNATVDPTTTEERLGILDDCQPRSSGVTSLTSVGKFLWKKLLPGCISGRSGGGMGFKKLEDAFQFPARGTQKGQDL
jgi:hypothetical protein